jgi:hypothetical protein
MDLASSVATNKALIHDIDLKIVGPSSTLYGNQFAGDQFNNVEQVIISSPAAGTYTVTVTSKAILTSGGASTTQKVSLVITSVGSVTAVSAVSSVTDAVANFPLGCPSGQSQVTTVRVDHRTNGWGGSNTYSIDKVSDSSVVKSGTLDDSTNGNFLQYDTFCIADGQYSATLTLGGSGTSEIGFSIPACGVYLDASNIVDTFTISSNTCGACADHTLALTLIGSKYGVPYGWFSTSSFTVVSNDLAVNLEGTLLMGISDFRNLCLPDGGYNITFNDVPLEDDFEGGTSLYGIEEYQIQFKCGGTNVALRTYICQYSSGVPVSCTRVMQLAHIRLQGGACTVEYITTGDISAASTLLAQRDIFALLTAVAVFVIGMFFV